MGFNYNAKKKGVRKALPPALERDFQHQPIHDLEDKLHPPLAKDADPI